MSVQDVLDNDEADDGVIRDITETIVEHDDAYDGEICEVGMPVTNFHS
jgi:hypothetical protein